MIHITYLNLPLTADGPYGKLKIRTPVPWFYLRRTF